MLKLLLTAVLGSLAAGACAAAVLASPWWSAAAVPLLLLALVAVHDLVQRRHSVLRNYPVFGHLRFAMEALRPELQQYFIERNFDGRPFDRDTRSIVYERAKGTDAEEPFGTELDLYRSGSEYLVPSMAPRPVSTTPPRVRIGGPDCTRPYDMALLNVSAMSFGSLSAKAVRALNTGARLGGFAHDTGEGGLSDHHLGPGGDLVWEIGTGYFGCRSDEGGFDERKFAEKAAHEQVKCVSLKISQGAKPGIGGVLPGAKVNAEIAKVRGVRQGEPVISPPFHRVYSTPSELVRFLARMRELADGKPVGFKLCVGSRREFLAVCKAMLEEGSTPDFVIVDGAEGGTGAAPLEFVDNVGLPLGEGLMAVLTVPGDLGGQELTDDRPLRFALDRSVTRPDDPALAEAAALLNSASRVTLLVGRGARESRAEVLAAAERLAAPMVLTLKAKEGFEDGNAFQVGQTGLIGNPAAVHALDHGDALLMLGTDFPYRDWYPQGCKVVQVDTREENLGRRVPVDVGLTGDVGATLRALLPLLEETADRTHLEDARDRFARWQEGQQRLADPAHERRWTGRLRSALDNRDHQIRPEALAAAVDAYAAEDAVFTSDTGMATVWLSRFVTMRGSRRLIGSYNLGSRANAMPQALGAQLWAPDRQIVAFCGDGGLSMLLGDLMTIRTYRLPVKLVVFDNRRLGMVKLEQEQAGLPEFGTQLDNPDFAAVATALGLTGIRVTDPADLEDSVRRAFETPGPVLLDVLTNPEEVAVPGKPTVSQGWGFAVAKVREILPGGGD
ncbi:glutamate synthase-related protein [Streptomyces sp. NPDC059193]|uniref:glutamate synthase-related protein n=1 Tax=Streptomyces sp. NPDC059193 TaxID=3346763 RepID=UPI0036C03B5C